MTRLQSHIKKARGNNWQADGRDADEQLSEFRGYDDNRSEGLNTLHPSDAMVLPSPAAVKSPADRHNETNPVLFVYQKGRTTKALSFKEAKEDAEKLEIAGWAHVATLDAKVFVEHHYGHESEAQRRYDAAIQHIEENANGFYNSDYKEIYLQDCQDVIKALHIAAGLPL